MSSSFPSGVPWTVHSVRLLPDSLSVRWDDGPNACNPDGGSPDEFPFVYLRDHCRCERCFHPVSLGRLSRLGELDFEVRAEAAEVTDGGGKVKVRWSDGHESRYDGEWLWRRAFCPGRSPERARPTGRSGLIAFLGDSDPVPTHSYQDVMESEEKLLDWLEDLDQKGLTVVRGMTSPSATLESLALRVAFPRLTHYGDYFVVESKNDPNNLAYTTGKLGLHLDEPHYGYTPGTQFLHCVYQHSGEGGDSVFSDGFKVADIIRKNYPREWRLLTETPVLYWDKGTEKKTGDYYKFNAAPIITLDSAGNVTKVTHNDQHRDIIASSPQRVREWYEAAKVWVGLLYHSDNLIRFKLEEGDCAVFDNVRFLHGRLGFTMGPGDRRKLVGCYMDWDEIRSRMNVIRDGRRRRSKSGGGTRQM